MIHLYRTGAQNPVCGVGAKRGENVMATRYKDLCIGCRAHQQRVSFEITKAQRIRKRNAG